MKERDHPTETILLYVSKDALCLPVSSTTTPTCITTGANSLNFSANMQPLQATMFEESDILG